MPLGLVLLTSCAGSDEARPSSTTIPSPSADLISKSTRAEQTCQRFRAKVSADAVLVASSPTTAGNVTQLLKRLGKSPVEPWASMDSNHFVAACSYGHASSSDTSVACADGRIVTGGGTPQATSAYLFDEAGSSSDDPAASPLPAPPDPCLR